MNKLRRIADLSAQVLREQKQLICDLAVKFEIELDHRSGRSVAVLPIS